MGNILNKELLSKNAKDFYYEFSGRSPLGRPGKYISYYQEFNDKFLTFCILFSKVQNRLDIFKTDQKTIDVGDLYKVPFYASGISGSSNNNVDVLNFIEHNIKKWRYNIDHPFNQLIEYTETQLTLTNLGLEFYNIIIEKLEQEDRNKQKEKFNVWLNEKHNKVINDPKYKWFILLIIPIFGFIGWVYKHFMS